MLTETYPMPFSDYFALLQRGFCLLRLSNCLNLFCSSVVCLVLVSATPGGFFRNATKAAKTQAPEIAAQTFISSLNASEYACLTACSCTRVIVLAEVCNVVSCSGETMPLKSCCCAIARIAVEAAIPMLPPRTRTWAMIP